MLEESKACTFLKQEIQLSKIDITIFKPVY